MVLGGPCQGLLGGVWWSTIICQCKLWVKGYLTGPTEAVPVPLSQNICKRIQENVSASQNYDSYFIVARFGQIMLASSWGVNFFFFIFRRSL